MGLFRSMAIAVSLASGMAGAGAQTADGPYPHKPITLVVPYGAGSVDFIARRVAERLESELGTQVVIDNKPGASTSIAAAFVARSRPDGYTLFLATPALSINPVLQPQLPPGNPVEAFAPVIRVAVTPFAIIAGPSAPFDSLEGLVSWANAHPGRLTVAVTGSATVMRMAIELFATRANITLTQVPYAGASGLTDLVGGRIDLAFIQTPDVATVSSRPGVKLLGVTSEKRVSSLPRLRAVGELYPGYAVTSWNGIFAPAKTPAPVLHKLNAAFNRALSNTRLRDDFSKVDVALVGGTPDDLKNHLGREIEQWTELKKKTGMGIE